jgi:hypothetical protein
MFKMFDEWEARRVIRQYNLLRVRANLPPIAVQEEIDQMREAILRAKKEYDDFIHKSQVRERVEEKLLNRIRRNRNDPNWRPFGMLSGGGLGFELDVTRRMERIWRRAVFAPHWPSTQSTP